MAAQLLFCNALIAILILFIAPPLSKSDDDDESEPLPRFIFGWPDDDDEFYTGDIATIKVGILGDYKAENYKHPFNPDLSVNDTMGNSSYVTDVHSILNPDMDNWRIVFKPITAGLFYVLITDENFHVYHSSLHFHVTPAEEYIAPTFTFHFLDEKTRFMAGYMAHIVVTVYDNFNTKKYKHPFNPNITLSDNLGQNEKMGNSTYISGVWSTLGTDTNKWQLHFTPIMVGCFHVLISQENLKIFDSSMHFNVDPGWLFIPACTVSWMDEVNEFVAGTKVTVLIVPKDAYGNNCTERFQGGYNIYSSTIYATHANGAPATILYVNDRGYNNLGYLTREFVPATSGRLLLHMKQENRTHIHGSPLPFTVHPEELVIGNCVPEWRTETNSYQLFSRMQTFITQRDRFMNLVPGFYAFDFDVVEKGTNLSLPISDLQYEEVEPGIQSFSFKVLQPGDFLLIITDKDKKIQIKNMPYEFNIYIGYCDGSKSIVNGSGLHTSIAGEASKFSILLRDAYQYPSPLELHRLRVQITLPALGLHVDPHIYPMDSVNGTQSTGTLDFGAFDPTGLASVPSVYSHNDVSGGTWETWNSAFEVVFVPEKAGVYKIRIFCGNIPLNDGNPFEKYVGEGEFNSSVSRVIKYDQKVSNSVVHAVDMQLVDSFSNPVFLPESKLSKLTLEPDSINKSSFMVVMFIRNRDGTYTGFYMPMNLGTYKICASFDGRHILPCPFEVTSYKREYFPIANGVDVSVWEDESIAFNPLENDYVFSGKAQLVEYQMPGHGSLLRSQPQPTYSGGPLGAGFFQEYRDLFRYTPYKGYNGIDSFTYSISDVNGNIASSHINLYVHRIPPEFVSFPTQLQADEDMLGPKIGGILGFEITYSEPSENISIMVSAQHGSVFLSPLLFQLWDPMWNELSITKMEGWSKGLNISGHLEVLNFALKLLQYIGDENFGGDDILRVTTGNRHGKRDLDVPIIVNPINDPPFINVPEFIMLENMTEDEGFLIFDRQRDNFSVSIGDPDHRGFPGNKSHFRVMFSVEVSSGFFSANLPAKLISTTELKLKNSKQWQPLQTFVEISRHFTVIAKAMRFRGTMNDCNTVLQQILYFGEEHNGVLKVSVNDMGWYGCYPDCEGMLSAPLISEATVNLITTMPVDSDIAHSLGSVIVIEFIVLSSLALILIFFTCKCVIVLLHKKMKNQPQSQSFQLYKQQSSHELMSSSDSSENMGEQTSSSSNSSHEESGSG